MAAARTSTPSHRPSSPCPLPTPESACSRPNEAPGPGHHLHASPERRRSGTAPSPAAARRGAASTDRLLALQGHLQVRADLLSLLRPGPSPPASPLAGKRRRHRLLCFGRPRTRLQESKCSRGLSAKVLFFLNFKSSKFVKSIENHRKIKKMQTKICWIPCSKIYNFSYRLIFSL